jgi:hypothetical protein
MGMLGFNCSSFLSRKGALLMEVYLYKGAIVEPASYHEDCKVKVLAERSCSAFLGLNSTQLD